MPSTQDVTGKQLPLVTAPAWELGVTRWDHMALGCSLLPHGSGSRRDLAGKKKGKRTLAGGP